MSENASLSIWQLFSLQYIYIDGSKDYDINNSEMNLGSVFSPRGKILTASYNDYVYGEERNEHPSQLVTDKRVLTCNFGSIVYFV